MKQSFFVTIKLYFSLHQTRSSMKELNTLKLIVTLLEKKCSMEKSILILSTLATSWLTYSLSPLDALVLSTFLTNLVHMTYMLQLEGEY